MLTIRKQEIASLTLQQACSIQERLNSEMAIADSKLRMVIDRNDKQFRKDYPCAVGTDYEGMGFAIPSNQVIKIVNELIRYGTV